MKLDWEENWNIVMQHVVFQKTETHWLEPGHNFTSLTTNITQGRVTVVTASESACCAVFPEEKLAACIFSPSLAFVPLRAWRIPRLQVQVPKCIVGRAYRGLACFLHFKDLLQGEMFIFVFFVLKFFTLQKLCKFRVALSRPGRHGHGIRRPTMHSKNSKHTERSDSERGMYFLVFLVKNFLLGLLLLLQRHANNWIVLLASVPLQFLRWREIHSDKIGQLRIARWYVKLHSDSIWLKFYFTTFSLARRATRYKAKRKNVMNLKRSDFLLRPLKRFVNFSEVP